MKIFISWSGKLSHEVALILKEWIPLMVSNVDLFLSSKDIGKGSPGDNRLAEELADSNFGIFCITKSSVKAPWVNFEAGAISKSEKAKVYTFLFGINHSEIEGPLKRFQSTKYEKEDFLQLITSINNELGDNHIQQDILQKRFNLLWGDLKDKLDKLEENIDLYEYEDFDNEGKFKGLKELNIGGGSDSIFEDIEHASSICILANTSKKLLTRFEDDIIEAVKNGCDVKIAISSPENNFLKDRSVRKGLCKRNEDIIGEINEVRDQLQEMIQRLKDQKLAIARGSIKVKAFSCVPTCAIIILNNKVLRHTPYLPYSESSPAPSFDIVNLSGSKLFGIYKETFNRVWENSDYLLGIDFKLNEEFPKQVLK